MAIKHEISKKVSPFERAKIFYSSLFAIGDIHVSPMELNLISFSAAFGTLSTPPLREEFLQKFGVKETYLNTVLPKLRKEGFLVKGEDKKLRVNPKILSPTLNFTEPLTLQINLHNEDTL